MCVQIKLCFSQLGPSHNYTAIFYPSASRQVWILKANRRVASIARNTKQVATITKVRIQLDTHEHSGGGTTF